MSNPSRWFARFLMTIITGFFRQELEQLFGIFVRAHEKLVPVKGFENIFHVLDITLSRIFVRK